MISTPLVFPPFSQGRPVAVPAAVRELVNELRAVVIGATHNQYAESDPMGSLRCIWLTDYLATRWEAPVVLVGEAAGWRGAALSGVAFTSVAQMGVGTTHEASATIVHRTLAHLGVEEEVLLWNVVPTHPHEPGNPRSNRPPTAGEQKAGAALLSAVASGRRVVAVGRIAARWTGAPAVRHPSRGGARAFEAGVAARFAREVDNPA